MPETFEISFNVVDKWPNEEKMGSFAKEQWSYDHRGINNHFRRHIFVWC